MSLNLRGSSAPAFPGYKSGMKYRQPASALSTFALTLNTARVAPVVIYKTATLSSIEVEVTTAATGGTVRPVIYTEKGDGSPLNLLVDAGALDASTLGVKSAAISVTLAPGIYWMGAAVQGALAATTRGLTATPLSPNVHAAGAAGNSINVGWATSMSGAAPSTWPTVTTADTTTGAPLVAFTVA